MLERLRESRKRFDEIEELLATPEVATDPARLQILSKEHASLEKIVELFNALSEATKNLALAKVNQKQKQTKNLVTKVILKQKH